MSEPTRSFVVPGCLFTLALAAAAPPAGAQVNVTTQHNDSARTGANLEETRLTTANVNANQFGKLFSRDVDGQLYAQPLYVSSVTLPGGTTHNVVYAATQNNSVYAFDADDPNPDAAPLWQVNLGHPAVTPTGDFAEIKFIPYHDLFPQVGITGTPVIDPSTNTLYVVAHTRELGVTGTYQYHHVLHALDITSGTEKLGGPKEISGSVPGDSDGSVGGMIAFDSIRHLQRPALLLSNGTVYIAFGSYADNDPSHGWVFAYDAATLRQVGIFNTTPHAPGGEGAIWQSNQGLLADAQGNVYFTTGNQRCDSTRCYAADAPVPGNYTEAVVKLTLGAEGLGVADWFMPCNQCNLDRGDTDLGSAGPLLVPDTNLLLAVGKQGRAYVLDTNNLGHLVNAPPSCGSVCTDSQTLQRIDNFASFNYSSPVFWNSPYGPTVYIWGTGDRLKAYGLENGLFHTTPDSQSAISAPWGGGGLSLSANGSTDGTGIVWGSFPPGGSSNPITQHGQLRAFDATDVSSDLWNSDQNPAFDSLGILAKYNLPTIAHGKVYMPSASGQLHVFGLLPDPPPPLVRLTAPTALSVIVGPADLTLTADALSRDGSPVDSVDFYADGELVGTATGEPPYSVVWSAASLGSHTLWAVAKAPNGAIAKSKSVAVKVVADAPSHGPIISINLAGTTQPMGPDEVAGVADLDLARANWNNAISEDPGHSRKEGWLTAKTLNDSTGADTRARMAWTANGVNSLFIFDDPGDLRMMRGYLDTSNTTSTNVTVYDLPASFIANGYDVVVYFDGANDSPPESRTAEYRIGSTVVSGTDAAEVDFAGTYTQAIGGTEGNYVVIPGVTGDRFTLEATATFSSGSTKRAPVNGIQLVGRTAP